MPSRQETLVKYFDKLDAFQKIAADSGVSLKKVLMKQPDMDVELVDLLLQKSANCPRFEKPQPPYDKCPTCGSTEIKNYECIKCGINISEYFFIKKQELEAVVSKYNLIFDDVATKFVTAEIRKFNSVLFSQAGTIALFRTANLFALKKNISITECLLNTMFYDATAVKKLITIFEDKLSELCLFCLSERMMEGVCQKCGNKIKEIEQGVPRNANPSGNTSPLKKLLTNRKNKGLNEIESLAFWYGLQWLGLIILLICFFMIAYGLQVNIIVKFMPLIPCLFLNLMIRSNRKKKEQVERDLESIELELAKEQKTSVHTEPTAPPTKIEPKPQDEDAYSKIRNLAELRDSGILTEEEFTEKKKDLLKTI